MSAIIKASEVSSMIWETLVNVVDEEYVGESEEVKEQAKAAILEAMSVSMFN